MVSFWSKLTSPEKASRLYLQNNLMLTDKHFSVGMGREFRSHFGRGLFWWRVAHGERCLTCGCPVRAWKPLELTPHFCTTGHCGSVRSLCWWPQVAGVWGAELAEGSLWITSCQPKLPPASHGAHKTATEKTCFVYQILAIGRQKVI